jgi:hypothetical protein
MVHFLKPKFKIQFPFNFFFSNYWIFNEEIYWKFSIFHTLGLNLWNRLHATILIKDNNIKSVIEFPYIYFCYFLEFFNDKIIQK